MSTETEIDGKIIEAVSINPLDLNTDFRKLPALVARYNELYSIALRKHLRAKAKLKHTHASVYLRLREGHSGGKVTETSLKAMVEIDKSYAAALDLAIVAEVDKERLWGVLEALRAKRDSLISMGATMRAEMQGDPALRDASRAERELNDSDDLEIDVDSD